MKRLTTALAAVVLVGALITGCSTQIGGGDVLATVNGQSITAEDLAVRTKIYELFFRQAMADPGSKQQLLDQMVNEQILIAQANSTGTKVTDEQVEAELAKFLGALEKQYQSRDQANGKLASLGLTNDDLAGFLKDFLLGQAVVEQKQAEVTLSDSELEAFYNENQESLYTFGEDRVRAAHILVPLDQEAKAREIAAKAQAGGDFAELARLYSQDPGNSRTGGDLGYFAREGMTPEVANAAFTLEVGQVSDPVRSQFGWHVIRLIDKQGPGVLPFAKAREDIVHRLLPQKQDEAITQWLDTLEAGANITKRSFTGGGAQP